MEEIKKLVSVLVDQETGEYLQYIYEGDSVKIKTKESKENISKYLKEEELKSSVDFKEKMKYTKMYRKSSAWLMTHLSSSEISAVHAISMVVSFADCICKHNGEYLGKVLTVKEIADETGINYNTFRKAIKTLEKYGIVAVCSVGKIKGAVGNTKKAIIVNPYVMTRGDKVLKSVFSLFSDTGWKEYMNGDYECVLDYNEVSEREREV